MTEPEKDQVTSSTPQDVAADVAATASADDARAAEVVADAEVIEANEAGELDAELEQAAAEAVASAIEESEELAAAKAEAADWQDKYVRLHAEWDTYRRRMTEQREAEKVRATEIQPRFFRIVFKAAPICIFFMLVLLLIYLWQFCTGKNLCALPDN